MRRNRGFSTLNEVFAMAVLGLTLFTFLAMSGRIFAASREAGHRQAAQSILDKVVAEVRAQPAAYPDGPTGPRDPGGDGVSSQPDRLARRCAT